MSLTYEPTFTLPACGPAVPPPATMEGLGGGPWALPRPPQLRVGLAVALGGLREIGGWGIPLVPIVLVIGAIVAIGKFIANLPANIASLIGLDPKPLADSVSNVATALLAVVGLANPAVAYTRMVRGFLVAYLAFAVALKSEVVGLIAATTNANALLAQATAAGCAAMVANVQCAQRNLVSRASALNGSIASAAPVIALFSYFLCLLSFGHLGPLPTIDPNALVAEVFDPVIDALTLLLTLIPDLAGPPLSC